MTFFTVFFQMLALLLMIGAGIIAGKRQMLDAHACTCISKTIVSIFNPMLVLSSAIASVGQIALSTLGEVSLVAVSMFAFFIVVGMLLTPLFDRDKETSKLFQLMFVFSNLGFIGIPVVSSILGAEYVIYVTVFILIYNVVFYTYGMAVMDGQLSLSSLKSMLNFGNFASVGALVIIALEIHLPSFIATAVTYLGNVASPLALVTIGFNLSRSNLKEIFGDRRLYVFSLVKLIILPCIALLLLRLAPINPILLPLYLVMFGMPVGNMPLMLGTERGIDCRVCSSSIIMSTLLCVFTVPLLMSLV